MDFNRMKSRARRQAGVAAVEFALVLPVLLVLLAGALLLGRVIFHYQASMRAAHDAALYLATAPRTEMINLGQTAAAASIANQIAAAELAELSPGPYPVVQTVLCIAHNTYNTCNGFTPPDRVSVNVELDVVDEVLLSYSGSFAPDGMLIDAGAVMPYVGR